jgi:hypothetical protein
VRRGRESAYDRKVPHGLPPSSLIPTNLLDEWFENEVKPRMRDEAHEIRFADDAVLSFQYKEDAEKVMEVLPRRFAKYGLTIHPERHGYWRSDDVSWTTTAHLDLCPAWRRKSCFRPLVLLRFSGSSSPT